MTKHQDVNKCRQQEKYKMAALIRQAKMANKPKIKKKIHGEKEGGKGKRQQHFVKRKRRQVMSASNGTEAGYR